MADTLKSEARAITEGNASSLGERFRQSVLATCGAYQPPWGPFDPMWEKAAVAFVCKLTYAESEGVREALLSSVLLEALKAVHAPYAHLTEEALEAGVLMEFGPPKPERGAALLKARATIAQAEQVAHG